MAATLNTQENGRGVKPRLDAESLKELDSWIRKTNIAELSLNVERPCGNLLPVGRCDTDLVPLKISDPVPVSSPLRIPASRWEDTVDLSNLFKQGERRILIYGHSGAGKTTLCKKVVRAFYGEEMWRDLFVRVVWVPLRYLITWKGPRYGLAEMLHHIDRQQCPGDTSSSSAPQHYEEGSAFRETLFVLDGLEEVSTLLDMQCESGLREFLLALLNHTDVIITTQPNTPYPYDLQPPNVKLEATGWSLRSVMDYLDEDGVPRSVSQGVQSLLRRSPLLQGLVRFPVMLDALCFVWEETLADCPLSDTFTQVYQAITERLWRKDLKRWKELLPAYPLPEIEEHAKREIQRLEAMAFVWACSNLAGSQSDDRDAIRQRTRPEPGHEPFEPSFVLKPSAQGAQFIHPTIGMFLAASYFARQWTTKKALFSEDDILPNARCIETSPLDFLSSNRDLGQLNVMWRFVSGLLDAKGEHEIIPFLDAIEKEPRDLTGPPRVRLLIHCLSEALRLPPEDRNSRESRISGYLRHRMDSAMIAADPELPDTILFDVLRHTHAKKAVMGALETSGRHLSGEALEFLVGLARTWDYENRRFIHGAFQVNNWSLTETAEALAVDLFENHEYHISCLGKEVLENKGFFADTTVKALVKLLEHEDSRVRHGAAVVLSEQLRLPRVAKAALRKLRYQEDLLAKGLRRGSALSKADVDGLVRLLRCVKRVRANAVEALRNQAKLPEAALAGLVNLLKDEDNDVQRRAVAALQWRTTLPEATIAAIVELFEHRTSRVRANAVEALLKQAKLPEAALADLVNLLQDEDIDVQRRAVAALQWRTTLPEATIAAIVELFEHRTSRVRANAVEALLKQAKLPEAALADLVNLLQDEDIEDRTSRVRDIVAETLENASIFNFSALAALVGLLKDEENRILEIPTPALCSQTTRPEAAVATLVKLSEDRVRRVRAEAVEALCNQAILRERALVDLVNFLTDEDVNVQRCAVAALQWRMTLPEAIITAIGELFEHRTSRVRANAVEALRNQAILPERALAGLVNLLKDEDIDVQRRAVAALQWRMTLPEAIITAIGELFEHKTSRVRANAVADLNMQPVSTVTAWAVGLGLPRDETIQPTAIVDAIVKLYEERASCVRAYAAKALQKQANLPDLIVAAVVNLFEDKNEEIMPPPPFWQ
ncbi:hypothetical protein CaCOL14_013420 [Colletotrichum acutatum]